MLGTLINTVAIIFGGLFGTFLGAKLMTRYKEIVMQGLSLAVILIGLEMALATDNMIHVIFSLMLGGLLGEYIMIEDRLDKIGQFFEARLSKDNKIADAFVQTSLIYCVGAMAIMGAIQDGLGQEPLILYTKSILDGFSAIAFASTLGPGVILSAGAVFLYQGSISLLANYMDLLLTQEIITEMSAVGGILIAAIGLNMLKVTEIRIGNLLPAIFIIVLLLLI